MTPSSLASSEPRYTAVHHHHRSPLSWAAIFGGLTAALAMQVLFMMLGAGLGFAIYQPISSDSPVEDLGKGAIIVQGVSAVFSLWFGGWIAGRFTPLVSRTAGCLHGLLVWCGATVAGVLVISLGAGWIMGDLSKLVGGGLSAAGKPAAAAVSSGADLAKDAAKQSTDTIASFVDEAAAGRSAEGNQANTVRAKREVGLALTRLFNPLQKEKMADNKTAVTKALVEQAGLKQADADRMVQEWTDTYNRLSADLAEAKKHAEEKARVAAEKAAHVLTFFSLGAFFAFVLGAVSAAFGGSQGAKAAFKHDYRGETVV